MDWVVPLLKIERLYLPRVKGSFGEFTDAARREAARMGCAWGVGALVGLSMATGNDL